MAADIPTTEPTEARAGDTWKWTKTLADYPASEGWALTYRFKSATAAFEVAASASGDDYSVTVAATTTDDIAAGFYTWVAQVSLAGEKYTVDSGPFTVNPDFHTGTASAAYDGRSHARIVVDAIEAVIEGRASRDQEAYEIAGRSLKRTPIADLLKLRQHYRAELATEEAAQRIANNVGAGRKIQFRL